MAARLILPAFVAVLVLLAIVPGVPPFWITLLNNIGLAALVAIGLVLLTGVGGMTSFGQAAFCGFGAYTTAILTTTYGPSASLQVSPLQPCFLASSRSGCRVTICRSARSPGALACISCLGRSTCSAATTA